MEALQWFDKEVVGLTKYKLDISSWSSLLFYDTDHYTHMRFISVSPNSDALMSQGTGLWFLCLINEPINYYNNVN